MTTLGRILSRRGGAAVAGVFGRAPVRGARWSHGATGHDESVPNPPFEFTKENMARAKAIMAKYPEQYKKAAIIPLLDLGQRQLGLDQLVGDAPCCSNCRSASNAGL